ncbi:hypothetical protein ACH5RR_021486 [Cinchona calisaya]|uniref:Uncharacterized protein n=1 Tax=Cinchona calisaya TaxID=153742 RepID=A0ABD2ZL87_9GENT
MEGALICRLLRVENNNDADRMHCNVLATIQGGRVSLAKCLLFRVMGIWIQAEARGMGNATEDKGINGKRNQST